MAGYRCSASVAMRCSESVRSYHCKSGPRSKVRHGIRDTNCLCEQAQHFESKSMQMLIVTPLCPQPLSPQLLITENSTTARARLIV